MASPRCQSRDSSSGGRCPSDESVYSGRGIGGQNALSPVAITLPPTLPPAALLPLNSQHSAAMAAYLNVAAAAAAQQNRLLLASPLRLHRERSMSPADNDEPVLDFSKKRKASSDQSDSNDENNSDNDVNMSKTESSPLDLSVSRKRVTRDDTLQHSPRKMPRPGHDYKPSIVTPWTSPVAAQLPFFANAVAGLSPKTLSSDWNGKNKMHHSLPSDATKALEKMSELSRIGDEMFRSSNNNNNNSSHGGSHVGGNSGSGSSGVSVGASTTGRHSAWQSHWLNKGADSAKDVLKCVWCKQSFPSLAAMTTHMKETKHCGVSVPPQSNSHQQTQSHQSHAQSSSSNSHNSNSKSDLNLLIKETMPLPRKLVRGQDVWLGKGAEQTRQILKCMWCGQSFRSLSEMTTHMQQTQHYTNIISQEQIISWKTGQAPTQANSTSGSNREGSGSGNESNSTEKAPASTASSNTNNNNPPNSAATSTNSHVSAVLTCKVCDQAFSSLKELSNHMVKNAHYKEHIMRSITESGTRRKQTREKRKKSLPVRKLLELERAQNDFKNGESAILNKPLRDISAGRITCEKCGDKIDTALFVDHIRQCIGSSAGMSPAQKLKSALMSNTIIPPDSISPVITPNSRDGRKSEISDSDMTSPNSIRQRSPVSTNSLDLSNKSGKDNSEKTSSSPSVLNAIEQLIEKSFDTRSRHGSTNFPSVNQNTSTLGSSILKRLGIDESVDYTKPLVDAQTMNLLRNYHSQQTYLASQFARRERSGSESSSISERGSSRVDSLTPEKKFDVSSVHTSSLRATPDNNNKANAHNDSDDDKPLKIKSELPDDNDDKQNNVKSSGIRIKKELHDDDDENDLRNSSRESANQNNVTDDEDDKPLKLIKPGRNVNRRTPQASPMASPANSPLSDHHSIASRSTPSEATKKALGSLGALSSMFDNLGNVDRPNAENGQGKRTKAHPLAALQKLCDKTENNPNARSSSQNSNTLLSASPSLQQHNSRTGAILAFSWACNDAIMSDESNIKCAFCDTSFTSKGAYRHHLSKAHFVSDDAIPEAVPLKANSNKLPPPSQSPKSPISNSPKSNASAEMNRGNGLARMKKSPSPVGNQSTNDRHNKSELSVATPASTSSSSAASAAFDESPHSKFLKYTELAKQLSSKYV